MAFEVALLGEALAAGLAAVGSLPGVDPTMGLQVAQLGEAPAAEGAGEGPLPAVGLEVGPQVAGVGEVPPALAAAQGDLAGVGVVGLRPSLDEVLVEGVLGLDADPLVVSGEADSPRSLVALQVSLGRQGCLGVSVLWRRHLGGGVCRCRVDLG